MSNLIGLKKYNHFRISLERYHCINLLGPYHRKGGRSHHFLDLSDNINHFLGDYAHYPEVFYSKLNSTIAEYVIPLFNGDCGIYANNGILPTNGVVSAIDTIIKAFSPSESLIVSFTPSFPVYAYYANIHRVNYYESKLWGENLERINVNEIVLLQPTILFICDPNNPTGSSINDGDIETLLVECPDTLFVFDETYQEYSSKHTNLKKLNKHDNLIILRNFSKAWGLAALRVGAIISTNQIISALTRCVIPFSISALSEKEFIYCVQNKSVMISDTWRITCLERARLVDQIKKIPNIVKIYESDANFICFVVHDMNLFNEKLEKFNIKIEILDPLIANAYRLTIGTKLENDYFISAVMS